MHRRIGVCLAAVLLASGGCGTVPQVSRVCNVDRAAEERAIRELSASYPEVRDVESEVAQYTEDVWFFSTLTPAPTVGRAARRQSIVARRAPAPGEHTRRETTGVIVSDCGDLAVEHGRFVTTWAGATGPESAAGFYLLTYRKVNGEWKIAAASVHSRP